jgi:hypothetical protein
MTADERHEMYLEKRRFVENLNEALQMEPRCTSVEGVHYEVYTKDYGDDRVDTREWVIVHFVGGGKSVKLVTGNSNIANFKVIGSMLVGGYYTEVYTYQKQIEDGYTKEVL